MNKLATILLFINFVTVLFPQPGYIHPDEFFQSTEIVAGDILGVSHTRAWEFNASSPVRNVVFPYLLTAPSLYLLKYLNATNVVGLKISAVKIVMATRLPIAFLSLFGFIATDRLAKRFKADGYLSQVLWCSSYVTWTYFTRTFSNSTEASLLAIILLITLNSLSCASKRNKPLSEKSRERTSEEEESEDNGDGNAESRQNPDEKIGSQSDSTKNGDEGKAVSKNEDSSQCQSVGQVACILSFVLIAGFFNRPTFLIFAFIPLLYWFVNVCKLSSSFISCTLSVLLWASVGGLTAFILCVAADTFYYNPNSINTISQCVENVIEAQFSLESISNNVHVLRSVLVVTPWNFLKYNINAENLSEHGLHPRYLHLLVNLPVLLGPLFFPVIAVCMLSLAQLLLQSKRTENRNNSLWLVLMALVPIAGLSVFPHQEPRFLIPLLPILIVLGTKLVVYMATGKKLFFILWVVFNLSFNLIYGYVHQAAIIPALSIYQQKLSSPKTVSKLIAGGTNHAFFYKTYPPPLHLLLLDPDQNHFKVHDLAGTNVREVVSKVKTIEKKRWAVNGKNQVFIFMPSTASQRVTDLLASDLKEYGVKLSTTSICPHFSSESLPRFRQFWSKRLAFDDFIMDFCLNVLVIS